MAKWQLNTYLTSDPQGQGEVTPTFVFTREELDLIAAAIDKAAMGADYVHFTPSESIELDRIMVMLDQAGQAMEED